MSQACVSNCNSCPDSKSCSTCARDYNLLADKSGCVLNCPAGFKASSSFECVASGATTTPAVCFAFALDVLSFVFVFIF